MTTKRPAAPLRFLAAACLLALAAGLSGPAAGETTPAAEPMDRMARLQEIGSRASELATKALDMLGIRYKYGSSTPEHGLDCSGLVQYVFRDVWGKELPRTSAEISRVGERIDPNELRPGDLVFYNTLRRGFSHVGIYLGDSKFIHAPSSGGTVRIESMNLAYWKKRFNGARRISEPER